MRRLHTRVLEAEHILSGDALRALNLAVTNATVGQHFDSWCEQLRRFGCTDQVRATERRCLEHFLHVTDNMRPHLIHCYDLEVLPRTNNDYEEIYLHEYGAPQDARQGIMRYMGFSNHERPQQALDYRPPAARYFAPPSYQSFAVVHARMNHSRPTIDSHTVRDECRPLRLEIAQFGRGAFRQQIGYWAEAVPIIDVARAGIQPRARQMQFAEEGPDDDLVVAFAGWLAPHCGQWRCWRT